MTKEIRHNIHDSVFADLFSFPENQLAAYRAVHPEDTDVTMENITDVTIRNTMVYDVYNDMSITVDRNGTSLNVVFFEAQSSWSANLPLRMLFYFTTYVERYLQETKQSLHDRKSITLPHPEFYVVYSGKGHASDDQLSFAQLYLSGDDSFLELKVNVIHGNGDDIISQYLSFDRILREMRERYGDTRTAVLETIRECKSRDILTEYLSTRESEVIEMSMMLFDQDTAVRMFIESNKREWEATGEAKGEAIGEARGTVMTLEGLVSDGVITLEDAALRSGLTKEEFLSKVREYSKEAAPDTVQS